MKNSNYLPFALPDIDDKEIDSVINCMKSGWLTTGNVTKKFEQDFAAFISKDVEAVSVNSATMGMLLVLEGLGIKPGDEVIVPTYTFSATAMVVVHLGAKPVFVDVNPHTLNIDHTKIAAAITSKTKAIIPVHIAGLACDLMEIKSIAKDHNLKVIEDAAHALPATYLQRTIGDNTSDATVYSFYATKTITTGEGGMIVTSNKELASRCRQMRLHGISRDIFNRYNTPGAKWEYDVAAPGYKCNLTDIASSIGIEQLKKANDFLRRRTYIAEIYLEAFENLPIILPARAETGDVHSWHLFVIRIKNSAKLNRDEFISKMDELGIGCSVHFKPLHLHSFYQSEFGYREGQFPHAEEAFYNAVSLPIYTAMEDSGIEKVIESVKKILC